MRQHKEVKVKNKKIGKEIEVDQEMLEYFDQMFDDWVDMIQKVKVDFRRKCYGGKEEKGGRGILIREYLNCKNKWNIIEVSSIEDFVNGTTEPRLLAEEITYLEMISKYPQSQRIEEWREDANKRM